MFLVTSITMLRERTTGTLERLMTMPLAKLDLLAGYAIAFAVARRGAGDASSRWSRSACSTSTSHGPRWRRSSRSRSANAVLGMALGLFVSAFARTEFQAVQFMPAIVFPQLLLCGLFVARAQMAGWLRAISDALPLTYAYDALARVTQAARPRRAVRVRPRRDGRRHAARARARRRDAAPAHRLE